MTPASTQPSTHEALCACPGVLGTSTSARPAPASAAGIAAIAVPRSISPATCHNDPPRARSTVSSSARRTAIVNDATKITAIPTTIMLTNSSRSTVWVAAWVSRNADRSCVAGEVAVSATAPEAPSPPNSTGIAVRARPRSSASRWAWSAFTPPSASGNSHCICRPGPPNLFCIKVSALGSAKTPPAQYPPDNDGRPTVLSWVQKVDPASRSATIAVTSSSTGPDRAVSWSREPGCRPNRAAVCVVTATGTAPARTPAGEYEPATTRALAVNGSR